MTKQMRTVFDKELIISTIAQYISKLTNIPAETYTSDHNLLDDYVKTAKNFDWYAVASTLNIDRWRLYHWYFETFQRMITGHISADDCAIIQQQISAALQSKQNLDKQFQNHLKSLLSTEYHRSTFSIAFNNIKRQTIQNLPVLKKKEIQIIEIQPKKVNEDNDEFQNAIRSVQIQLELQKLMQ
ncbi:Conserved_hypothetical protein [Hexamita inflata]|uniref:Uncharacterized protein n=1 Tax=Hexamita inflata TaxID=28002 RepID=A0AA86UJJ3_9EUKA|nr:Conserved hypothetical protein [Hexamita inflata]